MRKIIYSLLPIIAILFFSVGCSDDVIKEESIIEVGQPEVIFSKEAQEKVVSVTVDTGDTFTTKWSNSGTVEWGGITSDATGVKISVSENASDYARIGLVTITTADKRTSEFIKIHQNGSSLALETLPDNLKFNQLAGSKTIAITDASDKWSISNENEWITIVARREFNEAIITVTENTGIERVAKLIVTAGSSKKEITVTQTEPIDLIMPFLDFTRYDLDGGTIPDSIRKFELERGSHFTGFGRTGSHEYRTPSKSFPEIWYSIGRVDKFVYQIIMQPSNWEVLDNPDFRQQMVDNGFEYVFTRELGGKDLYEYHWRAEYEEEGGNKRGVTLIIDKVLGEVQFFYPWDRPLDPAQQQDFPTFEALPRGFSDWTATKDEINAWEEAQGGTLQEEIEPEAGMKQLLFKTNKTNPREEFERLYWIDEKPAKPEFIQTMLMYKDITMALYLSTDGVYYHTREFKQLLIDSGFEMMISGSETYYHNPLEDRNIFIKLVLYDDGSGTKEETLWIILQKTDVSPTSALISSLSVPFKIPNASMEILR